jgi:Double zinc ribbon
MGGLLYWLDIARDVAIVVGALVWVASIAWVLRDATDRGVNRLAAGGLAVVFPFVGAFLYALVRPHTRVGDVRERELWLQLATASARVPRCPTCSAAVEREYVVCPSCTQVLRRRCSSCGAPNDFAWTACPYCGTTEDAQEWAVREPARAAASAEVTALQPASRRRRKPAKAKAAPANRESAV